MGTDLEVGIRIDVPGIVIEAPGNVVLPIARFLSILRESSDEKLDVESDGRKIQVRGQRSEFQLPSENPDEFPVVAAFEEAKYHEMPARFFREIVRRTVFATDNESSRYALGGVLIELTGRPDHGRGHRWPAAGPAGRTGQIGRRAPPATAPRSSPPGPCN